MRDSHVRFDVAAMLAHRQWASGKELFRYVSSDASPQMRQSQEVFVTAERSVERVVIDGRSVSEIDAAAIHVRLLPLATLGQGKASLAEKNQRACSSDVV